ncbi:MAG: amidohydrolase [Clostridia bacterium]|nr:amidohydrolase [Clostridia bacterium]
MKYHFFNAQILVKGSIIKGDVLVENNKIIYVGSKPPKFSPDRKIDVKNNILMSGFVNAHCHTPSSVLRGISDDLPLNEWLAKIIPFERAMTEEDIYWATMLGIAEYVSGGITTVEENYGNIIPIMKAYKKASFRARISIGFPNVKQDLTNTLKWQLEQVQNFGFKPVCFAHSIYGTNEKNFETLTTFAKQNNLPVSTHLSETLKEVGDCSVKYKKTPVELLEDYGFLDRQCTLYHMVHCDKDDLKIVSDYNASIITCPSSNLKLASGIAPLFAMQNAGINIGIGTDGAYSNNSFDMFKEMFLVATLEKANLYNASILRAEQALDMATKNGAKILGYENLGEIKKGNLADIILVDIQKPHHYPHHNLISNLVYSAKSSDVYLTMTNGKIVYENGQFDIGENIEEIYKNCLKIKKRILEE